MSLAEDVTALQTRIADAQRQKARAEGARDTARAALENALVELKQEFHVDNADAGNELLGQFRDELTALVEQINAKLDEIGV